MNAVVTSQYGTITPDDVEALSGLTRPRWQRFVADYVSGALAYLKWLREIDKAGHGDASSLQSIALAMLAGRRDTESLRGQAKPRPRPLKS